ncbi:Polyketide synthase, enoylreductase [Stemphylium lycopersici]|uniref:Polyketide synthase, enoylreductase n=1 Tax=Stemphylium lycopersici TaxID=183478 RepID=A0A364MS65_STELY|nr:polyketide enoylreductase [Stemphylium lycopersici]RAQ98770.1 Polyketide synthase, enoylreductase [Stemphylium lycopersici]RAR01188.1 Polyketide synthase, enoylreductase [Stemphylium lycopersici]
MNAYQFLGAEEGIVLRKLPIPEPNNEQALIKVEAAGLCHSDTHVLHGGGAAWMRALPITLGHEIAGTIVKLGGSKSGPRASPLKHGDKVAVACVGHPIEARSFEHAPGVGYDGGYAEYVTAYVENIVKIPENVSFAHAAVATDAVSTAYHAVVVEGNVTETTTVAIVGLGGLGLNGLAIAAARGAQVYGVDINTSKFENAISMGAVECATSLSQLSTQHFDVIVDFAGAQSTVEAAVTTVKLGGIVVVVGLASDTIKLSTTNIVTRNITIRGSTSASIEDLRNVISLISSGVIQPLVEEIAFHDIPKELERLSSNQVTGRLFTVPVPDR